MGVKRIVDTSFWVDGKVDEFSPEDKYFMLYLLTNPFSKQLGIYEISIKQAAFQMGYSVDAFRALLDRFEKKGCRFFMESWTNQQFPILPNSLLERLEPDPEGDIMAYQRWCEQLDELEELGKDNALYAELAKIVKANGGLWCAEAEAYLLAHAPRI